jgi:CheY-like chemotaxis protein
MQQPSILVVDDDSDVRTMMRMILAAEGYTAECAGDGVEAIDYLRTHAPALVLVDLILPRMNGAALIRAMAGDPTMASIPVAIMSGQTTALASAQAPQVVAQLIKPVEIDELLKIVHQFGGARTTVVGRS